MKRVSAFISNRFLPLSGAEISIIERLSLLQENSFSCNIISIDSCLEKNNTVKMLELMNIQYLEDKDCIEYQYENIPVKIYFEDKFFQAIRLSISLLKNTDFIIAFFISPLTYYVCSEIKVKTVYFIHSKGFPKVKDKMPAGMKEYILRQKKFFVASEFMKKEFYKEWGLEAKVFYELINLEKYLVRDNVKKFITLINPAEKKGLNLFLKIAEKLNEKQFLIVGGWQDHQESIRKIKKKYPNISYQPPEKNMKKVYQKTGILLFPSLYEEAFGRVIIEAALNGIPVISSNKGALPETVSEGGILLNPEDINRWISTLIKFESPDYYQEYSEKSLNRAKNYYSGLKQNSEDFIRIFRI